MSILLLVRRSDGFFWSEVQILSGENFVLPLKKSEKSSENFLNFNNHVGDSVREMSSNEITQIPSISSAWKDSCIKLKVQKGIMGLKLGKEYEKAAYYHPAYLTYMQST